MNKTSTTAPAPQTFGPYSPIRQQGNTYYISGQIGVDPKTRTASSDTTEQVHQALKNLGNALGSAGLRYDHVAKTTLYLMDMRQLAEVNEVYVSYFNEPRPARTTIGVSDLPHIAGDTKLVFEIDAVAVKEAA